MNKATTTVLAAFAAFSTALATSPATPSKPAEADIASHFEAWKNALASKDPTTVATLFAPDAILQPTVSNEIRNSPEPVEKRPAALVP